MRKHERSPSLIMKISPRQPGPHSLQNKHLLPIKKMSLLFRGTRCKFISILGHDGGGSHFFHEKIVEQKSHHRHRHPLYHPHYPLSTISLTSSSLLIFISINKDYSHIPWQVALQVEIYSIQLHKITKSYIIFLLEHREIIYIIYVTQKNMEFFKLRNTTQLIIWRKIN